MGVTNLIPGPNSTEMAMQIGYWRAGWAGLVVAGACFILPAAFITGVIAWIYVQYHDLPRVAAMLRGISPAVLAIILCAVWKLGKAAIKNWQLAAVGLGVAVASLFGCDQLLSLIAGTLLGAIVLGATRRTTNRSGKATSDWLRRSWPSAARRPAAAASAARRSLRRRRFGNWGSSF